MTLVVYAYGCTNQPPQSMESNLKKFIEQGLSCVDTDYLFCLNIPKPNDNLVLPIGDNIFVVDVFPVFSDKTSKAYGTWYYGLQLFRETHNKVYNNYIFVKATACGPSSPNWVEQFIERLSPEVGLYTTNILWFRRSHRKNKTIFFTKIGVHMQSFVFAVTSTCLDVILPSFLLAQEKRKLQFLLPIIIIRSKQNIASLYDCQNIDYRKQHQIDDVEKLYEIMKSHGLCWDSNIPNISTDPRNKLF